MSLRTRSRELMLPLLLFPVPFRGAGHGGGNDEHSDGGESSTLLDRVASHYDVVFTTACLGLFETVLQADEKEPSPSWRF